MTDDKRPRGLGAAQTSGGDPLYDVAVLSNCNPPKAFGAGKLLPKTIQDVTLAQDQKAVSHESHECHGVMVNQGSFPGAAR
jgi:hypothetical protein